ncbi:MAG: hypothetical protein EXS38_10970 [Opitutus sp.]|nr:hypothetical protein [Opitutus sp.]
MPVPVPTRRTFLHAGLASGATLALSALARAATPAARPPSAMNSHRNLFNGDCNFLFYNPELWQPEGGPYHVRAIQRYVDLLASSGIDTLLINPNTQVTWYPSKKLEYILAGYRRGDRAFAHSVAVGNATLSPVQTEQYTEHLLRLFDHYLDLTDAGVDWLAACAAACRARGVSPWLSYRMNATHFSGAPDSPVNCRLFREPRHRLSGRIPAAAGTTHAGWIGLNYGQPAVRDYMLAMLREGVEAYDYEGLEMDWLRHPVCLEVGAGQRQIDEMTDWFAAVKAKARTRRPDFPVGLRVPANLGYLRAIGIDVKALVQRHLVDFITFSNFWQTSWEMPLDELRRELGPDVTLYGGMEDAPNWLETHAPTLTERPKYQELQLAGDNAFQTARPAEAAKRIRGTRYLSASAAMLRANAVGKLVLGADGLAQFNFFVTDQVRVPGQRADFAALRQLSDLAFLRGQEKHYALNTASPQPTKIWDVPEQLPVKIPPRHRRELRLPMCAEPAHANLQFFVQVVTSQPGPNPACGVSFNGAWPVFENHETEDLLFPAGPYSRHVEENTARNYLLDARAIRDGWNEIALYNESSSEVNIVAVELGLRKPRS